MKKHLRASSVYIIFCISLALVFTGCSKSDSKPTVTSGPDASTYTADVVNKWMTLQIRLMRDATGLPNIAFSRYYVYSGIVAYESLKPGISKNPYKIPWNGLTGLPQIETNQKYIWPASVNAGLASINKSIFTTATAADKAAIDSLENAINGSFSPADSSAVNRSNTFGNSIATAVFNWAETDNYKNASAPYTLPVGPGSWIPTPPAFAAASTPFWGNVRTTIDGSIANSQPAAPTAYSEDANSAFYKMAKELYDSSQVLTTERKNQAIFWKDIPGVTSPGHWLSILQQVLTIRNVKLDKAASAYAITGACMADALISCWQTKYKYNLIRPVSVMQSAVFGHSTWATVIPTPAHPEYSSAHAVLSSAEADAFAFLFGNIGSFIDHTYDYVPLPSRTYASFKAIGEDAGYSRFYAGIHYMPTVVAGLAQGSVVTANIIAKISTGK